MLSADGAEVTSFKVKIDSLVQGVADPWTCAMSFTGGTLPSLSHIGSEWSFGLSDQKVCGALNEIKWGSEDVVCCPPGEQVMPLAAEPASQAFNFPENL